MRHHQGKAAGPAGSASALEGKRGLPELTRVHRVLIGVVVAGAVLIAAIGFAGSYAAVHKLAMEKGFGTFAHVFPIGIDAGIVVLLGLDLLLTWIRIPFPLLRQTAWLLTAATIAFNAASAWPDPLGVGMHGVIPVLFVVAVEAARHAVGRIADITADKHMEGVRITRWLLAPLPTFKLWRRMKLWEVRSYETAVGMEQERMIYQARLQARYGRSWRRKAPLEAKMPLRLARYGVPLAETASAGLEAAGIELPPQLERTDAVRPELPAVPQQTDREAVGGDTADRSEPDPSPAEPRYEMRPQTYAPVSRSLQLATAAGPLAAHADGRRPAIVQARLDWSKSAPELSPIGDSPESAVPDGTASAETVPSVPESQDDSQLVGAELLEHRYLQLTPAERAQSASALARLLHEGSGFTEGTARKYLRPIIDKHS